MADQPTEDPARIGRPPTTPRLEAIEPGDFLGLIRGLALSRASGLGLGPGSMSRAAEEMSARAEAVFHYARAGGDAPEASLEVVDRMVTGRADPLVSQPLHGTGSDSAVLRLDDVMGVVLLAAAARARLAAGKPISVAHLAALSSSAESGIRARVRDGTLRPAARDDRRGNGRDFAILPSHAVKWLAAKGVPGFVAPRAAADA